MQDFVCKFEKNDVSFVTVDAMIMMQLHGPLSEFPNRVNQSSYVTSRFGSFCLLRRLSHDFGSCSSALH
jgi:hypothetical protein